MKTTGWRWAALGLSLLATLPSPGVAQVGVPADTLRLAAAVRAALESDARIVAATARVGQAGAARGVAAAARLPSVTTAALVQRFGEPMVVAPLHGFDPTRPPDFDATLIQGRVLMSQTVYDGGATRARIDGARALEAAAEAGVGDARAAVLEELAEIWLGVLSARDVLAAESARVLDLEAEQARATQMFQEGTTPRLAMLRAEAELAVAQASVEGAEARRTLAEATLARRIGVPAEVVAAYALEDVLADVAARHVLSVGPSEPAALTAARARVAAAAAKADEASAAKRPHLSATGALQELGGASSGFRTEWQGGVQVDFALFTGGARARALEAARAGQAEMQAQLEELERRHLDAAEAAQASHQEAFVRGDALENAIRSLEELVRIERLALEEGAGVQRDFLQASAELAGARAGLAQARRAAVLASVRLARATGRLTPEWMLTLTEVGR